jgi:hypothetical protein
MTFRVRPVPLLVGLAVLLLGAGIAAASASAIESPYWKVNSKRLVSKETQKAQMKLAIEGEKAKELIIKGNVEKGAGSKVVNEVHCNSLTTKSGNIIGSNNMFDGQAEFLLAPAGCKLLINFGEGFFEEKLCTVAVEPAEELKSRLWYEGTEAARGTKIALSFEAPDIAKITITGASCKLAGKYILEGSTAGTVSPQTGEPKALKVLLPNPSIEQLWQPQSPPKKEPELKLNGNRTTIQGEFEIVLESGVNFGVSEI